MGERNPNVLIRKHFTVSLFIFLAPPFSLFSPSYPIYWSWLLTPTLVRRGW
jgi:hypothetical protein